jgi:hypothetical protein
MHMGLVSWFFGRVWPQYLFDFLSVALNIVLGVLLDMVFLSGFWLCLS